MTSATRTRITRDVLFAAAAISIAGVLFAALAGEGSHPSCLVFAGRFHPLAVHLPIGVLLLASLLEGLALSPTLRIRTDATFALVLRIALACSVAAFALGLMLAEGGGYPERLLRLHRRLMFATVVGSAVSVVVWTLHVERQVPRLAHRCAVGATVMLLGLGAHFGGSMTHGEGYLVEYAPPFAKRWLGREETRAEEAPGSSRATTAEPRVFADVVLPILKEKCGGCHGADTAKGQLRLDSFDAMMKGGKSGPAVSSADRSRSLVMQRIAKPVTEDGHMPPKSKPQLSSEEVELISMWIDRGASSEMKVRDVIIPDGAHRLLMNASAPVSERPELRPTTATTTEASPPSTTTEEPHPTPQHAASAESRLRPASNPVPRRRPLDGGVHTGPPPASSLVPATEEAPQVALRRPRLFADVVRPILATRCGRCHSGARPAGGIVMTDRSALIAKAYVTPGNPNASPLLLRVTLPLTDDDHMPPLDAAQPSRAEIEAIRSWIQHGAHGDDAVSSE
ncbi:MAG TPA: c-type cytochrome domain-containing protein [Labilithrix sp.]|nr:c-type cytochrome domain-containing protein [Labilithrix sp.]